MRKKERMEIILRRSWWMLVFMIIKDRKLHSLPSWAKVWAGLKGERGRAGWYSGVSAGTTAS